MKQRTRGQYRLIFAAFGALLAFLALLLWQGIRRGDAVRVGIPRSAAAMGAAMLLQTPSAQYTCTVGSTPQALATALEAGELDAALLPFSLARSLRDCQLRAAVGHEPLMILTRQADELRLEELDGGTLTLPEALRGAPAEDMLRRVLRQGRVDCKIVYGEPADPCACDADTAAALLAADAGWRMALSVSDEWQRLFSSDPPAGLCLAVRRDYLAGSGSDYASFERALKNSLQYSADKRKKTVAMAVAAGFAGSEETADAIYGGLDFFWHEL
ncbi:MAG: hypothetical protein IJ157_02835 [Clostridia bacterium]|nr:hypothetical protein [Clostridia bacterium]